MQRVAQAGQSLEAQAQVHLYPYQKAWILDDSRFKLSVKSRQIGFTFGTTLRHVRRRLKLKGVTVWISASDRQSKEAIGYAKTHAQAMDEVFEHEEIEFPGIDDRAQQLTFKHNGARILAMPANPDTIRGYSGDVVLDEYAFHRDPKAIWKGALGIISRGHNMEVISTPNGQQGSYFDRCKKAGVPMIPEDDTLGQWTKQGWSVHHVDIFRAVAQGCPINPAEMENAADDEDTWQQEYCCYFLADAANYIPMELVVSCENDAATMEIPHGLNPRGELYLGVDIGRKKDRTVLWLLERVGDVLWTRAVKVLDRTPFRAQEEEIDSLMPYVNRAAIDATGIGAQLAEGRVEKWGESRVEAVEFNIKNKESMATNTKSKFEERGIRIPAAAFIRRSINAVKRFTSPTGHFRFDADRTDAGHADEFWALALACAASAAPHVSTEFLASRTRQAHTAAQAYAS